MYTVAAVVREERSSEKKFIFDTILKILISKTEYAKITVLTILSHKFKTNFLLEEFKMTTRRIT